MRCTSCINKDTALRGPCIESLQYTTVWEAPLPSGKAWHGNVRTPRTTLTRGTTAFSRALRTVITATHVCQLPPGLMVNYSCHLVPDCDRLEFVPG